MQTAAHVNLSKVVQAYGSFTALAKRLGLTLSTVHGWHVRKNIPAWRRKEIIAAANEDGIDICKGRRAKARRQ